VLFRCLLTCAGKPKGMTQSYVAAFPWQIALLTNGYRKGSGNALG